MKRTQAFIVLGFVVSFMLTIGFFMQASSEREKRVTAERNLFSVIEAKKASEARFNKQLESASNLIREKDIVVSNLLTELENSRQSNIKLSQKLALLNTRIALNKEKKRAVELEKIVVTSMLEAEGKVLAVDKENDLVIVSLGSVNNAKNGDRLSIYRGKDFIANAELVKVQSEISAAMLLSGGKAKNKDIDVKVNDLAKLL
ncbi:MAG: hypothetical protein WC569_01825 [Candidatus Omnitrophota bacterium]